MASSLFSQEVSKGFSDYLRGVRHLEDGYCVNPEAERRRQEQMAYLERMAGPSKPQQEQAPVVPVQNKVLLLCG